MFLHEVSMKKIVRVEIVAELEIDTDWYPKGYTDEQILDDEKHNWHEWVHENYISDEFSIRDKKDKKSCTFYFTSFNGKKK